MVVAAFDRLDAITNAGPTGESYNQNSRNWAIFTHNIFDLTDTISLTVGWRYTSERKRFDASFGNDNTACPANQAALGPLLTGPLGATAGGIIALTCNANSSSELNGVTIRDRRSEDAHTGTAILSWRPNSDWLFYGSFAHGYKAGGFNLDRSALQAPLRPFAATPGGAQGLVRNLQFDPEFVDSYEIGVKYSTGPLTVNVAAFRQEYSNFQLNTFNGSVFLVQNVNGCPGGLVGGAGADRDTSAVTGACAPDDVTFGVKAQGVELEASLVPARNFRVGMGMTYTNTGYRDDLVGNSRGTPLDPALRFLPGDNLSNAPEWVATGSVSWTPPIGDSGLSGLFYVDARMTSDYNTGSDLFPQKEQDGYTLVNARIGVRGPDKRWSLELWAQNLFNVDYAQVAFNAPYQAGAAGAPFTDANNFPGGRQIFSQFLAEPRTFGITARGSF